MTDLIQRLTDATVNERGLFEDAFGLLFPEPEPGCEPTWRRENPKQPKYHAWKTRKIAFRRMLDAEAWTSAAEMLVPEGWIARRYMVTRYVPHAWEVAVDYAHGGWIGESDHSSALALLIAALKAHGGNDAE